MLHAVIMAGGSGTRFWPESRRETPKQLLRLTGERTMLQETVGRLDGWVDRDSTWIVTNERQAPQTSRQLPDLPEDRVLIEPCPRNTAPCIGLAAIHLLAQDPEAVMLVMPADHAIRPDETFRTAAEQAVSLVERQPEAFVLFGVPPTYASTGFGYIERGGPLQDAVESAYRVRSFREKPDHGTAEKYLQSGDFYWNCGIFVWRAQAILAALERFEPEMHARLMRLAEAVGTDGWSDALEAEFPQMNSVSVDYAVLERADNVCVLEAPFAWDDVGSWQALPRLQGADENGNTVNGRHCGIDTTGCVIRTDDEHLVATVGVENLVVVHTPDATLVARKDDEDGLKRLVQRLEELGYDAYL